MKKRFDIIGLTCASCANDLEDILNQTEGISKASISFAQAKLDIESNEDLMDKKDIEKISKAHGHIIKLKDEKDVDIKKTLSIEVILNIIGMNVFILAIILERSNLLLDALPLFLIYILAYLLIGTKVIYRAFMNLVKGNLFDEHFLMTIATLGAIGIGEMIEAVAVMLFYRIGEFLQDLSIEKSRKNIKALMDIKPDVAHLVKNEEIITIDPNLLDINDIILVKPGEKVPVDGVVVSGYSSLDVKSIKGEALPVDVIKGDMIYSGSLNLTGAIKISVLKKYSDSTASKIIEFIENNQNKKAKTESYITRFSKVYTPIVVFIAIVLAFLIPWIMSLLSQETYQSLFPLYFKRAMILLVISCPCALVLSIPLSYFAGIGAASKIGMLFKGGKLTQPRRDIVGHD